MGLLECSSVAGSLSTGSIAEAAAPQRARRRRRVSGTRSASRVGHARLSIIDLETGAQPLYSPDARLVLVCNGELYDFERQRGELQREGSRFTTNSDSELIIHLYLKYGEHFYQHLRGEFAFLLYDRSLGRLIAARDRFGIKPLYVARTKAGGWAFRPK